MSSVEHNMYYIAGRIEAEDVIKQLQDKLYMKTGVSIDGYQRRTPHLTFLNRIKLPVHQEGDVNSELNEYNPSQIPIEITGVCVWPSIEKPRYVSLTVDAQIKEYQQKFENMIADKEGDVLTEPPKPHITLFKTENPHDVTKRTKEKLKRLQDKDLSIQTCIPYIDLLDSRIDSELQEFENESNSTLDTVPVLFSD